MLFYFHGSSIVTLLVIAITFFQSVVALSTNVYYASIQAKRKGENIMGDIVQWPKQELFWRNYRMRERCDSKKITRGVIESEMNLMRLLLPEDTMLDDDKFWQHVCPHVGIVTMYKATACKQCGKKWEIPE